MTSSLADHPAAKLVLIVDDDSDIRALLAEFLDVHGYTTVAFSNGLDALAYLHEGPLPSVILLDLMMPIMNGFQFREAQQQDPAIAAIPVVVMTARGSLERGMTGIAEVLAKPMDLDRLLAALGRV